jgi:hypothetical protein
MHDTYRPRGKPPEPTVCPGCGATFHAGLWQWAGPPDGARRSRCPACRRIRDGCPAGTVSIGGEFAAAHAGEIVHAVRNVEKMEMSRLPLNRIMRIDATARATLVSTTDMHLARRIGEALHRAFHGELHLEHVEESGVLRVRWRR